MSANDTKLSVSAAVAYSKAKGGPSSPEYFRKLAKEGKLTLTVAGLDKWLASRSNKAAGTGAIWVKVKMTRAAFAAVRNVPGVEEVEDPADARKEQRAALTAKGEDELSALGISL